MQNGLKSYFIFDSDYFSSKDIVSGTLHLLTKTSLMIEKISLNLTRDCSISMTNIQERELVKYSCNFDLFDGSNRHSRYVRFSPGHHQYSFKFYLKKEDSASCDFRFYSGNSHVTLRNEYILTAHLHAHGVYLPYKLCEKEINVVDKYSGDELITKKNFRLELASCLAIFTQNTKIHAFLSKQIYNTGDRLKATINSSRNYDISRIETFLYQKIEFAFGDSYLKKHILISSNSVKFKKCECEIEHNIPIDLPSTITDANFLINYSLHIIFMLVRAPPVRIELDIFLIRRVAKTHEELCENYIPGVKSTCKFLTLHN